MVVGSVVVDAEQFSGVQGRTLQHEPLTLAQTGESTCASRGDCCSDGGSVNRRVKNSTDTVGAIRLPGVLQIVPDASADTGIMLEEPRYSLISSETSLVRLKSRDSPV